MDAPLLEGKGKKMDLTYYEINQEVEKAIREGYGLRVDLDPAELDLYGEELQQVWDDLAPGEGFVIVRHLMPASEAS